MRTKDKLTDKQARFAQEYMKDFNATQAASRAGYRKKTAYSQGQRMLTNVDIKKAIEVGQSEIAGRNGITVDEIVATARRTIKRRKVWGKKYDPDNVLKANEQLGRMIGAFTDKVNHNHRMVNFTITEA